MKKSVRLFLGFIIIKFVNFSIGMCSGVTEEQNLNFLRSLQLKISTDIPRVTRRVNEGVNKFKSALEWYKGKRVFIPLHIIDDLKMTRELDSELGDLIKYYYI